MVGCVVVRGAEKVGEGWHEAAGLPHAEINALEMAGNAARGATLYVNLEPCSHIGRTGPCAEAVVRAGVTRVVAAMEDPNPVVAGRGFAMLRAAGIDVVTGVLAAEAAHLNAAFAHWHRTATTYITLKAAMSLDGKIAAANGVSRWITGSAARQKAHRMRSHTGAVLVGSGTLLQDDPELTARPRRYKPLRQPLRVVVDSRLRTPATSRAVQRCAADPRQYPMLVVGTVGAPACAAEALLSAGVQVELLAADRSGRVDLGLLTRLLADRGIQSVLCEGGPEIQTAFLNGGFVNRLALFVAPVVLGGDASVIQGYAPVDPASGRRFLKPTVRRFGADLLIETAPTPGDGG